MLLQADAFRIPLLDKSVHCVVTSPPYWGLRKYQGDQGEEPLGLEPTPGRHIERMVDVFREVRRVLRDDGVVWLNYGDCFAGAPGSKSSNDGVTFAKQASNTGARRAGGVKGMQGGSLMLMPHRLAIALQDDGWIIRNDVVWYKRNPMPESVAGWWFDAESGKLTKKSWRHTRAHEYVFQLVKKMGYYCNQEAVREQPQRKSEVNWKPADLERYTRDPRLDEQGTHKDWRKYNKTDVVSGRNPRSVMDVPTAPYKGAHYATFPPNLIAPLIRASCPRRACPECGQAWAAVVERERIPNPGHKWGSRGDDPHSKHSSHKESELTKSTVTDYLPTCECGKACPDCDGGSTTWTITCPVCLNKGKVAHDPVPGKVLDIFGGSGTTGAVAKQLLRDWIVMDISRSYLDEQAKIRTKTSTPANSLEGLPLFNEIIREED